MFWIVFIFAVFPQTNVDKVCIENREKKADLSIQGIQAIEEKVRTYQDMSLQKPFPFERYGRPASISKEFFTTEPIFSGSGDFKSISTGKADLYIGPGPDTFFIDTNYVQRGNITISGKGVLLVDGAKLTLYGHLWGQNQGQAIFRNGAYLHVNQQYHSQYLQFFCDSARFEAIDATVDGNVCYRTFLLGSSEYVANRTHFPHWNFRQLYDNSRLIMEDANMVGDLTINDSCEVHFIRCDTILPWFGVGEGDFVDVQFPDYDTVEHFRFDTTHPGIKGIKYSVTFDTCHTVPWGIESWPGCTVNVKNTFLLSGALRIPGSDTVYFNNVNNLTFYPSLSLPFTDRSFQIVNSYVWVWCIYTYDEAVLYMDSCFWGESHAKDNSTIYAVSCSTNGFPSSVTSTEGGFFSFVNGKVTAFVSSWNRAATYLENVIVTPTRPGIQQKTNIAHGHSYMLCVNTKFDSFPPFAIDTALVMFVGIDSPASGMIDTTIDIFGSAWIDVGPYNPITFDRYKLYWAYEDSFSWNLIENSTSAVDNNVLGVWNTSGLNEGKYDLRLTIWDSAGDSLTAFGDITLFGLGIEEESELRAYKFLKVEPTLLTFSTNIKYGINNIGKVRIDVYNLTGQTVKILIDEHQKTGNYTVKWDGRDDNKKLMPSGIYFVKLNVGDFSETKKLLLLR